MYSCDQDRQQREDCVILNEGPGAWALEEHAKRLSEVLGIEVCESPHAFNYLLAWDQAAPPTGNLFIPFDAINIASDKRLQARIFQDSAIATPETILVATPAEVKNIVATRSEMQWCLKYPTSCGASGHRLLTNETEIPTTDWPQPYIVQEFIRSVRPAVYRLYCAGGKCFGFNVRKFPEGKAAKPWVAHAQGARYEILQQSLPTAVAQQTRKALEVCGLLDSFGCVDLLFDTRRNAWLVLEIGTDGLYNHVDRDLGNESASKEIDQNIAEAFWRWVGKMRNVES